MPTPFVLLFPGLAFVAHVSFAQQPNAPTRSEQQPISIAPGDLRRSEAISGRCPTFHWSVIADATAIEIAIYSISAAGGVDEVEPIRRFTLPGSPASYTPPLHSCLARERDYAWTMRAIHHGAPGPWAEPRFFSVAAAPSQAEVADALATLRAFREVGDRHAVDARDADDGALPASPTSHRARDPASGVIRTRSSVLAAGSPNAHLKVAGEVRTIDPNDPDGPARLWGKGRLGVAVHGKLVFFPTTSEVPCSHAGVKYGLSRVEVDWGSAADACPMGTWVCRRDEIVACNTIREDDTDDGAGCNGRPIDFGPSLHHGWTADSFAGVGRYFDEGGGHAGTPTCGTLPVWCCWK